MYTAQLVIVAPRTDRRVQGPIDLLARRDYRGAFTRGRLPTVGLQLPVFSLMATADGSETGPVKRGEFRMAELGLSLRGSECRPDSLSLLDEDDCCGGNVCGRRAADAANACNN